MLRSISAALAILAGSIPCVQANDFIDDSRVSLMLRNFYFDRDFVSGPGQSRAEEWAQGFIFSAESGYTPGLIGFGVDLQANLGIKLDGGPGRTGAGLLPVGPTSGEPVDDYSWLGLTAKARISATELKAGTLSPMQPVILSVPMRLFAPSFRGAMLRSQEFERLTVHAGQMNRINLRNSSNMEKMRVSSPFGRFIASAESDRFRFAGVDYRWSDSLVTSWQQARLEDIYRQDYLGAIHHLALPLGQLKSDLRYFNSREDGSARAGKVDNRHLGLMLSWRLGHHTLGLGQMRNSGATALPYIDGTSVHAHSEGALVSEYVNPKERTSQARYDYDFAGLGLSGLTGMLRYIHGDRVELAGFTDDGRESEFGMELAYTLQTGSLKGLKLRARHAHYRSDFLRDANELRINIDYTLNF